MSTLCQKPADIHLGAETCAILMALRSTLRVNRLGLDRVTDPELLRIIRKAIAVAQYEIRKIEEAA